MKCGGFDQQKSFVRSGGESSNGAPPGTPQPVVDLLNREINAALDEPAIRQRIAALGGIALQGDAGQFGAMLAAETESWRRIVESLSVHKEG
ncbi:tripartite tricarboxylate transporter substrate-binding protein [Rhodopseudomonas palustris]|uniref:tripartite tricarboxylate transporter substrate-binding protein n=1 Tax=Rhodopseudomonas palustris TaxID=1076 RepID=UPI001F37D3C8|nr:tripartite tricarboxylate transporter substrate-binding protein [Rhodopseudomonas palustris]